MYKPSWRITTSVPLGGVFSCREITVKWAELAQLGTEPSKGYSCILEILMYRQLEKSGEGEGRVANAAARLYHTNYREIYTPRVSEVVLNAHNC